MRLSIPKGLVFCGVQAFFWACSTVPKEAPEEYHKAQAAMDRADQSKVKDLLPNTTHRIDQEFNEALQLYSKSRDKDLEPKTRDDLLQSGKQKAQKVQSLSEESISLQEKIQSWDSNIEGFTAMELETQNQKNQIKQLQAEIQNRMSQPVQETSAAVALKGPVAYFSSNQSDIDARFKANIESIARTLKADLRNKVTLSGFADSRGSRSNNDRLAKERAAKVASLLTEEGVDESQIIIQASPTAPSKSSPTRDEAELQLDRRVEATISTNITEAPQERSR